MNTTMNLVKVCDADLIVLVVKLEQQGIEALGRVIHGPGIRRVQNFLLLACPRPCLRQFIASLFPFSFSLFCIMMFDV